MIACKLEIDKSTQANKYVPMKYIVKTTEHWNKDPLSEIISPDSDPVNDVCVADV